MESKRLFLPAMASLLGPGLLLLIGCQGPKELSGRVLQEVSNPSKSERLLVVVDEHGVFGAGPYEFYLKHSSDDHYFKIMEADRVKNPRIYWSGEYSVHIEMDCGRVHSLKNFVYVKNSEKKVQMISVGVNIPELCEKSSFK